MAALKLITPPVNPVVSLSEAKSHLRVDDSDEDYLIAELVSSATEHVQRLTRRQFVHATYRLSLDTFTSCIRFPISPVASVASVQYVDLQGVAQTLSADLYKVDTDSEPARIVPANGQSWPSARSEVGAVRIDFVAGYSATGGGVPSDARAAVKLLLGHLYENREASIVGAAANELPLGVKSLVAALRWGGYP
jgi:uncharacterized phiE125 gp8 family phage protein